MAPSTALSLLSHPYQSLAPVTKGRSELKGAAASPGSALVWNLGADGPMSHAHLVKSRPGGLALIVVLPGVERMEQSPGLIAEVQAARPHGLLPTHDQPRAGEISQVLRRPALDLASEVTDYLRWRGILMDRDTTRLLQRVIELSAELRTITALSRGLYLSRRALGRRFANRGLPVPSHWLQVSRLLRLSSRLQNSDASIFSIAYECGYPDGFSVSNQMHRLIGYRPSDVRRFLGWEWVLEAWLRREADKGGLDPSKARSVLSGAQSIGAPRSMDEPSGKSLRWSRPRTPS